VLTKLDSSGEARLRRRTLTFTLRGPPETITIHTQYNERAKKIIPHTSRENTKHAATLCYDSKQRYKQKVSLNIEFEKKLKPYGTTMSVCVCVYNI
jgi:hypothetical protein